MTYTRRATARTGDFVTRSEDGRLFIDGYFAVFNSQYWLFEDGFETIDEGAFDLANDTDVRALTNHDTTLVLGRTTAGTLTLGVDSRGLFGTIEINPNDQDAVNLYERVRRGDVSQCSFGFDVLEEAIERSDNAPTVWHIKRVKLWEVSVVTFPAYEETGVTARKKELEEMDRRKAEEWRLAMLNKLKGESNGT